MLNMVQDFKELKIWKQAYNLTLSIYQLLDRIPESEKANIIDQLRRAVTSITLNIAEGCGSSSQKVFRSHLDHSYKSSNEVEALIYLCRDLKYFSPDEFEMIYKKVDSFKAALHIYKLHIEDNIKKARYKF